VVPGQNREIVLEAKNTKQLEIDNWIRLADMNMQNLVKVLCVFISVQLVFGLIIVIGSSMAVRDASQALQRGAENVADAYGLCKEAERQLQDQSLAIRNKGVELRELQESLASLQAWRDGAERNLDDLSRKVNKNQR
jgi:hypothetical protein